MQVRNSQSALFLSLFLIAAPGLALAGACPPDKVLKEPRNVEDTPDVGVERPILGTVDITGWRNSGNLMLRLRRLSVAPGGIVPTHSHDDRPSVVHILTGEIIEHSSFCAVPILHKGGETTPEFGAGHVHWWENKTNSTVTLFSADVVPFEARMNGDM